jgi:predicted amidophosphoribosyltransferase
MSRSLEFFAVCPDPACAFTWSARDPRGFPEFCPVCGIPLITHCPACGMVLRDATGICTLCGYPYKRSVFLRVSDLLEG